MMMMMMMGTTMMILTLGDDDDDGDGRCDDPPPTGQALAVGDRGVRVNWNDLHLDPLWQRNGALEWYLTVEVPRLKGDHVISGHGGAGRSGDDDDDE